MDNYLKEMEKSVKFIKEKIKKIPDKVIVLGSGLGSLADDVTDKTTIKYQDIPGFPISTVTGHKGELVFGKLDNIPVILMNGRFHYYEGYDLSKITYPIRIFKLLGVKTIVLTNAAGGINEHFHKGDLMIINDQLSFFAESALRGPNLDKFGERFIDMSNLYDKNYIKILKDVMKEIIGSYQEGVYAYMKGPTYETPAEIRALKIMGADAVGMSTVPEAVVAHHSSIKIAGISCITNMAAGITNERLSHVDVKKTALKAEENFKKVICEFIKRI